MSSNINKVIKSDLGERRVEIVEDDKCRAEDQQRCNYLSRSELELRLNVSSGSSGSSDKGVSRRKRKKQVGGKERSALSKGVPLSN
jgi:hypothetical protein